MVVSLLYGSVSAEAFARYPLQICGGLPLNNLFPHIEEVICTDATAPKSRYPGKGARRG